MRQTFYGLSDCIIVTFKNIISRLLGILLHLYSPTILSILALITALSARRNVATTFELYNFKVFQQFYRNFFQLITSIRLKFPSSEGQIKILKPILKKALKCHYDENCILQIRAILRHKQVVYIRVKMLFTVFKYLFSFQRFLSC